MISGIRTCKLYTFPTNYGSKINRRSNNCPPSGFIVKGDVAQEWNNWMKQFDSYAAATRLTELPGSVHAAKFIEVIGPECVEIYNSFNLTDEEKNDIELLKRKFTEHFNYKPNFTLERYQFNQLYQLENECFDNFFERIKEQSEKCGFRELKDGLLTDRIITGVKSEEVRVTLLSQHNLTLDKAIEICKADEIIHLQHEELNFIEPSTMLLNEEYDELTSQLQNSNLTDTINFLKEAMKELIETESNVDEACYYLNSNETLMSNYGTAEENTGCTNLVDEFIDTLGNLNGGNMNETCYENTNAGVYTQSEANENYQTYNYVEDQLQGNTAAELGIQSKIHGSGQEYYFGDQSYCEKTFATVYTRDEINKNNETYYTEDSLYNGNTYGGVCTQSEVDENEETYYAENQSYYEMTYTGVWDQNEVNGNGQIHSAEDQLLSYENTNSGIDTQSEIIGNIYNADQSSYENINFANSTQREINENEQIYNTKDGWSYDNTNLGIVSESEITENENENDETYSEDNNSSEDENATTSTDDTKESDPRYCKICKKTYKWNYYKNHQQRCFSNMKYKKNRPKCPKCHKVIRTKRRYTLHARICRGNYICDGCDHDFQTRYDLERHKKKNVCSKKKAKKISCSYDKCDLYFPSLRDMKSHVVKAHLEVDMIALNFKNSEEFEDWKEKEQESKLIKMVTRTCKKVKGVTHKYYTCVHSRKKFKKSRSVEKTTFSACPARMMVRIATDETVKVKYFFNHNHEPSDEDSE